MTSRTFDIRCNGCRKYLYSLGYHEQFTQEHADAQCDTCRRKQGVVSDVARRLEAARTEATQATVLKKEEAWRLILDWAQAVNRAVASDDYVVRYHDLVLTVPLTITEQREIFFELLNEDDSTSITYVVYNHAEWEPGTSLEAMRSEWFNDFKLFQSGDWNAV
ncbi:hypothetical protein [Ralstonia phage phiRSL1]|uniref:Uncharacterized protein n=1 Tax=Ralstonia phage phiRSL1 TaxID=1980924 RepID=B2ZXR1_9CAUD|nr:hypothetical protein RSL1_ORF047 [Ralstonia phage phiRSL1]BAG41492.1 hypothetical protein [Ralstonia phage phiRSL1]